MALSVQGSGTTTGANNPLSGDWDLATIDWQAGDLLIVWWWTRNVAKSVAEPATITPKIDNYAGTYGDMFIGYRYLEAGDSTFTWTSNTISNASTVYGQFVVRGGPPSGDPFESSSGANPTNFTDTQSPNPPATTPTTDNSIVLTFFGKTNDYAGSITAPDDYTLYGSGQDTAGSDASAGVAYRILIGGGGVSQDPGAWALGGAATDDGVTWTASIAPAGAARKWLFGART